MLKQKTSIMKKSKKNRKLIMKIVKKSQNTTKSFFLKRYSEKNPKNIKIINLLCSLL